MATGMNKIFPSGVSYFPKRVLDVTKIFLTLWLDDKKVWSDFNSVGFSAKRSVHFISATEIAFCVAMFTYAILTSPFVRPLAQLA